jgi:phage-related tail protein
MTIQQLSGIDTVVSNEKYNAYGTVKSRIANAYNRLPLEIQQLKFNEMLQNKLEDEINGIGGRRKKKPKAQRKEERKERRKEDKGLRALRLFMPLMRRKLKKKGVKITDPKSIKEVSTKFKTFIIDKKPINGFDDSDVIGLILPGAGAAAGEAVEVSAGLIKKIIDFIKGAIKKIKDRKKKGGKVSAEEEEDIKEGEAVEKEVESGAGGGAGGGMALPLLAAGAAALFLFKK